MKNLLIKLLSIALVSLIPNGAIAWEDLVKQVEKTTVQVQATGIDIEWITPSHSDEAKSLASFADSFNKTAYRDDLSAKEKCSILTPAANDAIDQKSTVFKGLYDVECSARYGSIFPELKMTIYPKTNFGYGFSINFIPELE